MQYSQKVMLTTLALVSPFLLQTKASALEAGAFVQRPILVMSITNHTSATADSGGNTVGNGGSVHTGSQSTSVETTNIVGSDDGGTDVETTITTDNDGVQSSQTTTQHAGPGEDIHINVSTGTNSGSSAETGGSGTHIEAEVHANSSSSLHEYSPRSLIRSLLPHTQVSSTTSSSSAPVGQAIAAAAEANVAVSGHPGNFLVTLFDRILRIFSFW